MLYLFWYSTFKVLFINALYNYLRQGAVMCCASISFHLYLVLF